MSTADIDIDKILSQASRAELQIQTLGTFAVRRAGQVINDKEWGRDKTLQLIQYFITARHQQSLHKEQVMDRLWDGEGTDQDFKVAMHGINKALEPDRKSRTEARYVIRQGITYQLAMDYISIDAQIMEQLITIGNQHLAADPEIAEKAYREALALHKGTYLPNRIYEDWSSEERERLQILALGAYTTLANLLKNTQPMETIRLAQHALEIDNTWEDAYRLIIEAFAINGNRPAAIKTYNQCVEVLDREYGIDPLPETIKLITAIKAR